MTIRIVNLQLCEYAGFGKYESIPQNHKLKVQLGGLDEERICMFTCTPDDLQVGIKKGLALFKAL